TGLLLLGADSEHALALKTAAVSPVETYGFSESADWVADELHAEDGRQRFCVRHGEGYVGAFDLPLLGRHNVRNALAAIAVGQTLGHDATTIAKGLKSFAGVKRRLEIVGGAGGGTVDDDFAPHPTAVAETLHAVREAYPGRRVWAVFEPRSASSCRRVFQKDFGDAFSTPDADDTIVAALFRSTLPPDQRLSVEDLVADVNAAGRRARPVAGVDTILDTIVGERQPGDVVVIMSNGGFDGIHQKLVSRLRQAART